jgi:hypothetical protein
MVVIAGGCANQIAPERTEEVDQLQSRSGALTQTEPMQDQADCDRGPTTMTTGATARLEISDFFIGGVFFENDTILRAKAHPECVAHIESAGKPFSAAGILTVRGAAATFEVHPDPATQEYFEFPDPPLFNFPGAAKIQVALSGAPGFSPIEPMILRSPALGTIEVSAPTIPVDGSQITVSSAAPFKFRWAVPDTSAGTSLRKQQVSARLFALGPERWAQLYCSWPIEGGHGRFPLVLLRAIREQLGETGALDAVIDIYAGELREVTTPRSSYVVFVTTDNATTFPRSTPVIFD